MRFKGKVQAINACMKTEFAYRNVRHLHSWVCVFKIVNLFKENIKLFLNVVKRVYSHVVGLTLFPSLLALRWGHERLDRLALTSILLLTREEYRQLKHSINTNKKRVNLQVLYSLKESQLYIKSDKGQTATAVLKLKQCFSTKGPQDDLNDFKSD